VKFNVEVEGFGEAMALLAVEKKVIPTTMEALYAEAQLVLAESKRQVPYRFGALSGSGMVHQPYSVGSKVAVEISYGGAAIPYAEVQHENLNFKHAEGRKAKYLEHPIDDAQGRLAKNIASRVAIMLRKRGSIPEGYDSVV
jgi:hypothetical protein